MTAVTAVLRRAVPDRSTVTAAVLVSLVGVVALGIVWSMEHASYDTYAGALIGLALGGLSLVLGRVIARREPDPRVARILFIAPVLKLVMTVARYATTFVIYDGNADAGVYHEHGERLAASYREGLFDAEIGLPFVGTGSIRVVTGLLYSVVGPTKLGAFFVFSFAGFWGLYLLYRAACTAVPELDRRRYAILTFLLPSLLFWPSSLGKESLITLGLGTLAYGSARMLTAARGGLVIVAIGLALTAMVRPHVAAMGALALMTAYVFRRRPAGASITSPLSKLAALVVLGGALMLVADQTQELLGLDRFNAEAVTTALNEVGDRTREGGSAFQNDNTDFDLSKLPASIIGVLFRPFPWEATNAQALIASAEGTVLLIAFIVGWRRHLGAIRSVLRTPYVVFCTVYTILFCYGFAGFSNFGILTRQRVQVLPFVLVLIALPALHVRRSEWRSVLVEPEPIAS